MTFAISIGFYLMPLLVFTACMLIFVKNLSLKQALGSIFLGIFSILPITLVQYFLKHLPIFNSITVLSLFVTVFIFNGLIAETLKMMFLFILPAKTMTLGAFVAAGMICGISVATFEASVLLLNGSALTLVRFLSLVLIHSFCTGLSSVYVWAFRHKQSYIMCFVFAVILHGLYNYFAGFSIRFWWFSIITVLYAGIRLRLAYKKISTR
ncbi:MAG: hypothetical protein MJ183_06000 [Treponemataceae bacterium]|nr:hypothetical protein [Treponemataceae bacterium]